jgi:TetR/AcrR family transcriptional regulator, cholesterol catabolism regulator
MSQTQRPPSDGQESRRNLLNCAARVFREQGYAAASLRDIADAAGMRTASMYYHFGSKDEIVAEVLNIAVQTVFAEVRKSVNMVAGSSAIVRIRAAVEAHLRAIFETDDYNGASIRIFAQIPPHIAEATVAQREEYVGFWKSLLSEAQSEGQLGEGDLTLLRLFLFGAMNWAPQWYKPGGYSLREIADELCDVFLLGAASASVERRALSNARELRLR